MRFAVRLTATVTHVRCARFLQFVRTATESIRSAVYWRWLQPQGPQHSFRDALHETLPLAAGGIWTYRAGICRLFCQSVRNRHGKHSSDEKAMRTNNLTAKIDLIALSRIRSEHEQFPHSQFDDCTPAKVGRK